VEPGEKVVDLKPRVESETEVLPEEQVLCLRGRPLCHWEVLQDLQPGEQQLWISFRQADPDWVQTLEDASCKGRTAFIELRKRQHVNVEKAIQNFHDIEVSLGQIVNTMKQSLKNTLTKLNSCGNEMLLATGDLQRNRDVVFDTIPRSSKGTRQAAEDLRYCRENVLCSVQENGSTLMTMLRELNPTHKAVMTGLREAAAALQHSKEVLRREGELIHLGQAQGWLYSDTAEHMMKSYRNLLEAIANDTKALETIVVDVRKSREAFRRAILINHNAIKHIETSLKQDQEIVFGWAMDHVSQEIRGKRDFILACVEANGEALEHAPEELKRDREIVHVAVQQSDGWALQFAAPQLKRDRDIVLAAVRRNGWALEYAAQEMKEDAGVVMAAVQANGEALEHAAEDLKRNREIVLTAIRRSNGWALQASSEEMQRDRELVLVAVRGNGLVFPIVVEEFRNDHEVVLTAVQASGAALEYVSEEMRGNREVVEAAIASNASALKFASEELRGDYNIVFKALHKDGAMFQFASEELRSNRQLLLIALHQSGTHVLLYASQDLQRDEEILKQSRQISRKRQPPIWSPRPEEGEHSTIVTL